MMKKWIKALRKKWDSTKRSLQKTLRSASKTGGKVLSFSEKQGTAYQNTSQTVKAPPVFSLKYPWYLTKQFFTFLVRLLESRSIVPLLQGTPALLAIIGVGAVFILAPDSQQQLGRVSARMRDLQDKQQLNDAEWFGRKAILLDPANENLRYSHALLLEEMGHDDECRAMMASLANSNEYVPAIEWLCKQEFQKIRKTGFTDTSSDELILHWLDVIFAQQPRKLDANFLLGSLHLARQRFSTAIAPLAIVVQDRPNFGPGLIALASAYKGSQQPGLAQKYASRAADAFAAERATKPNDETLLTQSVQALTLAARESEAIVQINDYLNLDSSKLKQMRWLQGDVYAAWTRRRMREEAGSAQGLAEAAHLIFEALKISPANPRVIEQLGIVACDIDMANDEFEAKLLSALDAGASPAMIHFILGTRQLLQDRPEEAQRHFSIAQQQQQAMPGLLNNLAELIMLEEAPDIERALTLVEKAIELMPNQPHFFDTRGKIYFRQKEYLKAIADFEQVLINEELRSGAHKRLADAYAGIGDLSAEKRHRVLANQTQEPKTE